MFDDAASPYVSVAYMLTDHVATELCSPWPFEHDIDLKNDGGGVARSADADLFPPTLSLQWHFNPDGRVQSVSSAQASTTRCSPARTLRSNTGLPDRRHLEHRRIVGAPLPGRHRRQVSASTGSSNAQVRWIDHWMPMRTVDPAGGRRASIVEAGQRCDLDPCLYGGRIRLPNSRHANPTPAAAPARSRRLPPLNPPPPPPAKCSDGDNDGVCDADDKCPGTPAGIKVDSVGCPLEQRLKLLFDFDSAELRPESLSELERLVKFMGDVPFATALIEGHTDSVGTDAYNQSLSDRRAKAVFDYLSSRGVDPARLKSMGKGESEPIADNKTAEGRQENRRVLMIRTDSGR